MMREQLTCSKNPVAVSDGIIKCGGGGGERKMSIERWECAFGEKKKKNYKEREWVA